MRSKKTVLRSEARPARHTISSVRILHDNIQIVQPQQHPLGEAFVYRVTLSDLCDMPHDMIVPVSWC